MRKLSQEKLKKVVKQKREKYHFPIEIKPNNNSMACKNAILLLATFINTIQYNLEE